MPRKPRNPKVVRELPYSVSVELNGAENTYRGSTLVSVLDAIESEQPKTLTLITAELDGRQAKLVVTIPKMKRFFINKTWRAIVAKRLDMALR